MTNVCDLELESAPYTFPSNYLCCWESRFPNFLIGIDSFPARKNMHIIALVRQ